MISSWLQHPLFLKGSIVELHPLEEENLDALFEVGRDRKIWQLTSVDYSDPVNFYPSFNAVLRDRHLGHAYAFVVCRKDGRIVGTTRLLDIQLQDRKVEIGVSWLASAFWGSGINTECKQLLLEYCFEVLGLNRVQFRTKADNARSRRALEKIGATFEGVLRKDKIEPTGQSRNTAFYSVIDDEWPDVKAQLAAQLAKQRMTSGADA